MSTEMCLTVQETASIVRIQLQQAVRSVHRSLTVPLVRNMSRLIDLDSDTLETCYVYYSQFGERLREDLIETKNNKI